MTESELVELFRAALMVEHHHDWTMDMVSDAAHICGRVGHRVVLGALLAEQQNEQAMRDAHTGQGY